MNVQQKQEMITKYVFELSEEERLAAIADPSRLVRELKLAPIATAAMGHASVDVTKKYVKAGRANQQKKNTAKVSRTRKVKAQSGAGDEKPFRCEQCESAFKTRGWLNQHEYKVHGIEHSGDVEIGKYGENGDD